MIPKTDYIKSKLFLHTCYKRVSQREQKLLIGTKNYYVLNKFVHIRAKILLIATKYYVRFTSKTIEYLVKKFGYTTIINVACTNITYPNYLKILI